MSNSQDNVDFEKMYSSYSKDFKLREEERSSINEKIQTIIESISNAESKLIDFGVFGANEQLHLASAKVELIHVLKSVEDNANTRSENNLRAFKNLVESKDV